MVEALDIHVKGIVQGVGFRPFVYRLAKKYLVNGWVLNATDGVFIHAEAESHLLDEFVLELSENAPAASHVTEINLKEVPLEDFDTFEIRFSDKSEVEKTTLISPDLATCDDCVNELFDPSDRRYRYPFINCTNCGPRFTIIESLPYDRKSTSMKDFPMCEKCAAEYSDPGNRRFHAQPDACFDCGPHISWTERVDLAAATGATATTNTAAATGVAATTTSMHDNVSRETFPNGNPTEKIEDTQFGNSVSRETSSSNTSTENATIKQGSVSRETSSEYNEAASSEKSPEFSEIIWGTTREKSDAIFARAIELLCDGGIVAVKGLGGFHLVCDANNPEAVAKLRSRKRREGKAFAVMMKDVEAVRSVCEVSEAEAGLLTSSQRPIVLLRKRPGVAFAPGLADKLPELGVMLPYTPVQHILLHDFEATIQKTMQNTPAVSSAADNSSAAASLAAPVSSDTPAVLGEPDDSGAPAISGAQDEQDRPVMLVMTSGNIHDEPIVIDDEDAYIKLADVADAFLGHNRAIRARYDDSVIRMIHAGSAGEAIQFIRRARGYAPLPLKLPDSCAVSDSSVQKNVLFATGPEQKNTFALTRDGEAFVSQHIGDMENAETYDAWLQAKSRFETLFEIEPTGIACDLHPEYLTSKWAHDQELPVAEVQHHHAHVASVAGENGLAEAVCGVAFDGTGYGVDGAIWGGEILISNLQAFERFANFAYIPMPGGAAAIQHPLRMAYGALWAFNLLDHPAASAALEKLGQQANVCDQMINSGLNTPMTSSVGRLFDAASALLGICTEPTYEGEPAILLEAALGATYDNAQLEIANSSDNVSRETASERTEDVAVYFATENVSRETSADGVDGVDEADEEEANERYAIDIIKNTATAGSTAQNTSVLLLDAQPTFRALLDDMDAGVALPVIARRFHDAFVQAIVTVAEFVYGLYGIKTVALSGGVFMNRYLIEHTLAALEEAGFTVAINRDLPPNDGCVSFGQAVIACSQQISSVSNEP